MNLNSNINFFLGLQNQIKVNHWQTKGYARHQAFGAFYDAMDVLIDRFVEEAMGKYGRFELDDETKTIELVNLKDMDIKSFIKTIREAFVQLNNQLDDTDTNLINIRDEMLGEVNKLSYLLTLE